MYFNGKSCERHKSVYNFWGFSRNFLNRENVSDFFCSFLVQPSSPEGEGGVGTSCPRGVPLLEANFVKLGPTLPERRGSRASRKQILTFLPYSCCSLSLQLSLSLSLSALLSQSTFFIFSIRPSPTTALSNSMLL